MNLKQNNKNKIYFKDTGIQILTPAISGRGEFLIPLIKAIGIISAVIGICEAISTAFSVYYDKTSVFLIVSLFAILLGMLDFSKSIKFVSLLSFICIYLQYAFAYREILKSGFFSFANIAYEVIRKRYSFPMVDGFPESYADKDFAITLLVVFGAILLTIMLDFIINGFFSVIVSIILTLAIFQTSIFFGSSIEVFSYIMLFCNWFTSIFLAFNGKYKMRKSKIKKCKNGFYFKNEKRGLSIAKSWVAIGLLFTIGTLLCGYIYNNISYKLPKNNKYKYIADTKVRNGMIFWFTKYKKYDINYKISRGQMGSYSYMSGSKNSGSVAITLVPYSKDPIYLKSFTGSNYDNNQWTENEDFESTKYINITANALKEAYEQQKDNCIMAKVSVQPLKNDDNFSYIPYNAVINSESGLNIISDSRIDASTNDTIDFYVYQPIAEKDFNDAVDKEIEEKKAEKRAELQSQGIDPDILGDEIYSEIEKERPVYEPINLNIDDDEYYEYVCEKYLNVPENNKKVFDKICEENGFNKDAENINEKISDYFKSNYTFTAYTGLIPWQTDFVDYFITQTKSGNMTHFASSATLLYRSMGIPARYAEGYIITPDDLDNADISEESSSERIFGIKTDKNVINTVLDTKSSFAWVEIYEKGYGWKPINITPVDTDSDEYKEIREDNSIVNFELIKALNNQQEPSPTNENENIKEKNMFQNIILIFIFIFAILLISMFFAKLIILFISLNKFNKIKNINARTDLLFEIIKKKHKISDNLTFSEYTNIISSYEKVNSEELKNIFNQIEKFSYSNTDITKEDYKKIIKDLNKLIFTIYFSLKKQKEI